MYKVLYRHHVLRTYLTIRVIHTMSIIIVRVWYCTVDIGRLSFFMYDAIYRCLVLSIRPICRNYIHDDRRKLRQRRSHRNTIDCRL